MERRIWCKSCKMDYKKEQFIPETLDKVDWAALEKEWQEIGKNYVCDMCLILKSSLPYDAFEALLKMIDRKIADHCEKRSSKPALRK